MSTTMKVPFSGKFVVSSKVEKRVMYPEYQIKPAQYPTHYFFGLSGNVTVTNIIHASTAF